MVHDPISDTNKRICLLNIFPDEVIRSLFYNKNNDSLITVSVYASDHFSSLKCRSTRIEWVYLPLYLVHIFSKSTCDVVFMYNLICNAIDTYKEVNQMPVFLFLSQSHWNGLALWSLMMLMGRCLPTLHKIGTLLFVYCIISLVV